MEHEAEIQVADLLKHLSNTNTKLLQLQKKVACGFATTSDINNLQNASRQAEIARKLFAVQVEYLSSKKQRQYKLMYAEILAEKLLSHSILHQRDAHFNNIPEETERLALHGIDMEDKVLSFAPLSEISELFLDQIRFDLRTNFSGYQYLNKLVLLSICDNRLTDAAFDGNGGFFSHFTSLKKLYLNNNNLTQIPSEVYTCLNLTVLSLADNQITAVPDQIKTFLHLKVLCLSSNKISSVSDNLVCLPALRALDLSNNQLTSLNKVFNFSSNRINLLNLSGNPLSSNDTWTAPQHPSSPTKLAQKILLSAYASPGDFTPQHE